MGAIAKRLVGTAPAKTDFVHFLMRSIAMGLVLAFPADTQVMGSRRELVYLGFGTHGQYTPIRNLLTWQTQGLHLRPP
jgi:hypothetical protein